MKSNPKNEPAMYMQNAIYGFWDNEENVSEENKKLLKKLGIRCKEDGGWLHFEMYEERCLPRELTEAETEAFADALGNLYMMLKAVFESNMLVDFENGDAVMRKYAGNGTWHNAAVSGGLLEEGADFRVELKYNADLKKIKNMPTKNFSIEIDERCVTPPVCDDKTETVFFPVLITATDAKSDYLYASDLIKYNENITDGLLSTISNICFKIGKPNKIITNDTEVIDRIEDFCDKTNIGLQFQKRLPHIEEALEDMFDYFGFDNTPSHNCSGDKTFYVSISLMTGCYRHIKISSGATLEELHETVIDAFNFDDDHAHVFFLNNKAWSNNGYYSKYIDDGRKHSCDYTIGQVLDDKHQFIYIFDFGDEWKFKCKVLKITDETCYEAEIVRSVGASPEQYPNYEEDY